MAQPISLIRNLSLKNRVMVFVAIVIVVGFIAVGQLVLHAVEQHFIDQDAEELVVITQAVAEKLALALDSSGEADEALAHAITGHHGVYYQVWSEPGKLIFRSPEISLPESLAHDPVFRKIRPQNLATWVVGQAPYRGAISLVDINGKMYRIASAISMESHMIFLRDFNRNLSLILTMTGLLTLFAAWLGVHRGHAPLRLLSESIRSIKAEQLDFRLETTTLAPELKPLADAFNQMISRLEDSFSRLSHFSADIAHELRTPLSNLATQTQVSLGRARSPEEYREILYSNLEEQERLTKMVNDMLLLAQSENGLLKYTWETIELMEQVQAAVEFFQALADESNVKISVQGEKTSILADKSMLRRVISNLLSNAIRYTPENQTIDITVRSEDGLAQMTIANPGSPIPPEHLPKLFDRFYRVDPSRQRHSEGAGLGLAIVKSIVEAHDGTISASSECGYTIFTVLLPTNSLAIDR